MNCQRVQSLLSAYLDHELSAEERRIIRQHLFFCRACSQEYETLSMLKNSLGRLEPPEEPMDLLARAFYFHHGAAPLATDSGTVINAFGLGKKFFMAAACTLLFLGVSVWLFPSPQSNSFTTNSAPLMIKTTSTTENATQVYTMKNEDEAKTKAEAEKEKDKEPGVKQKLHVNPDYPLLRGIVIQSSR